MAAAKPASTPRIELIRRYPVATLATFTDALMRFQQETGVPLHAADCVVTTTRIVHGSSVGLARSKWLITPQGLSQMSRRPASVINDGTARAWAALATRTSGQRVRGSAAIDLSRPGRRLLVIVDEGAGASVIDTDSTGSVRVLETEAGHAGFAPVDEHEDRLLVTLRKSGAASWERALLLRHDHRVWDEAAPRSSHAERLRRHAKLLGSFVDDHVLSFGSWGGVLLAGSAVGLGHGSEGPLEAGFCGQRPFRRQLSDVPCWKLEQADYVIRGGLELLGHRHRTLMHRLH